MSLLTMEELFFYMTAIGFITYFSTIVFLFLFRTKVQDMQMKLFDVDRETVNKTIYRYLASFKLFLVVFNLIPWIAILIMINQ